MLDKVFLFASANPILIAIFVALLALFIYFELQRGGQGVTPQQLSMLINREDALVVDLREGDAFRKGHISGSENIPKEQFDDDIEHLVKQGETRPIVLVCEIGTQSGSAGHKLLTRKLKQVYRLKGGIDAWRGESLPLIKE